MLQTVRNGGHPPGVGCQLQGPPGLGSPRIARRRVLRRARLRWLEANLKEEVVAPVAIAGNAAIGACAKYVQWQTWQQALGLLAVRLEVSGDLVPSGSSLDFSTEVVSQGPLAAEVFSLGGSVFSDTSLHKLDLAISSAEVVPQSPLAAEVVSLGGSVFSDTILHKLDLAISSNEVVSLGPLAAEVGFEKGAKLVMTGVITYDTAMSACEMDYEVAPDVATLSTSESSDVFAYDSACEKGAAAVPDATTFGTALSACEKGAAVGLDVICSDEDDYYE